MFLNNHTWTKRCGVLATLAGLSGAGSGGHQEAGIVSWTKQVPSSPSGLHAELSVSLPGKLACRSMHSLRRALGSPPVWKSTRRTGASRGMSGRTRCALTSSPCAVKFRASVVGGSSTGTYWPKSLFIQRNLKNVLSEVGREAIFPTVVGGFKEKNSSGRIPQSRALIKCFEMSFKKKKPPYRLGFIFCWFQEVENLSAQPRIKGENSSDRNVQEPKTDSSGKVELENF